MAAPVTNNKIFTTVDANNQVTAITGAGSASYTTIFTAGSNGALVRGIGLMSTDTVLANVLLGYLPSGGSVPPIATLEIGSVAITGNATLEAPTNLLTKVNVPCAKIDAQGNFILQLKAGDALQMKTVAALSTAKSVIAGVQGEDFGSA